MMRLSIVSAVAVLMMMTTAVSPAADNKLPDKAQMVLDKATSIEIYSLEPEKENDPNKDKFRGWRSLGKTTVEGDKKKEVFEVLTKSIAANAPGARCFIPRHGLRATNDNVTVEIVICFECSRIEVYVDKEAKVDLTVDKTPAVLLDKILKDAKIRVTEK
jgi:hypothetical protein